MFLYSKIIIISVNSIKMSDILKDSRFSKYLNDPRYRQIPKHERKVTIDKRFQSMFNDDKFKVKYTVDKRGRPVNETSTENLRKYYELESGESSESEDDSSEKHESAVPVDKVPSQPGQFVKRRLSVTDEEANKGTPQFNNDKLIRGKLDVKTKEKLLDLEIDYARGEGLLQTDSSSDEESSEVEDESDLEHDWGELDADAETTEDSTTRIAVCNMDWDNIKAADIMVLMNSFLPPRGVIHKITIYPSEFGLKRMQEEEARGPIELTEETEDLPDDANEEGSSYHMEKLRRYQLNRLKYYYAVVECDSVATADTLYRECDGLEYESSATKLDLRFIPDDVVFDQEPKEFCTKLPDMSRYKPRVFTTTALQQVKVDLTWDATNPNRTDVIKSALDGKIDDLDLKEYLASSTDEDTDKEDIYNRDDLENDDQDDPIMKYKNLLRDIQEKEEKKQNKDMEMEITWGLGIKDKAEELVKKKIKEGEKDLTPFEKLIQKRKEKKKQKKLERQKAIKEKENSSHSESESSEEIPSDIDMNDPYFAEEFNNPEFKKKKDIEKGKDKVNNNTPEEEKSKAVLELLLDEENDGKAHFSLKKIQEAENQSKKSRRKKKLKEKMNVKAETENDFQINLNDERFSAIYNSHLYNIDPTDPNFKKTKNMEKIIHEKLKRRPKENSVDTAMEVKKRKTDAEMSLLIKNIKRKTNNTSKS